MERNLPATLGLMVDRTAALCDRFFPEGLPVRAEHPPFAGTLDELVRETLKLIDELEPWSMPGRHPEGRETQADFLDFCCVRCLEAARRIEADDPETAAAIRLRIGEPADGLRHVRTGEPLGYVPPAETPLPAPDLVRLPRYFDTHAHYDDPRFDSDREETLSAVREAGVELVLIPGCDAASSAAAAALAESHSWIYAAAGIHPQEAAHVREEDYAAVTALLTHPRVKAVGEIGLDYYYEDAAPREVQREVFRRMLALARETGLPAIVHDREAHGDCLALIDEFPEVRGVFHCFSGSAEYARELVRRGWYISFTGSVTFKNAKGLLLAAQAVPDDRLMIETDSPYLAPEPYRGRRNDSRGLRRICARLAELRGTTPEALAALTLENGKRFFGI